LSFHTAWVKGRKSPFEQIWPALPQTADIGFSCEDFSVGPIGDIAWWLNEYSVLRRETTAAHPWISSLVSRLILVDPRGYEGTDEAQHENAGSRYNDQVN
jgi:hypothetical protein